LPIIFFLYFFPHHLWIFYLSVQTVKSIKYIE